MKSVSIGDAFVWVKRRHHRMLPDDIAVVVVTDRQWSPYMRQNLLTLWGCSAGQKPHAFNAGEDTVRSSLDFIELSKCKGSWEDRSTWYG